MDMPDLEPVQSPPRSTDRLALVCVAIFILVSFAFAMWINIPEWR
jgi:hypothetical protein